MNFYTRPLAAAIITTMSVQAMATTPITDYQFVGLNRVTFDSIRPLLPSTDKPMTEALLADSIRALYATEQFFDIQATVSGGTVVYTVAERPLIAEVNFKGNKLIPKEGLEQGLKQAGLSVGQVLKQATVHNVETELAEQYKIQGYYNSTITVTQTPLAGNRVKLDIAFNEGKAARVGAITITGNTHFSDADIRRTLLLKERVINPLSRANRYSEEKFQASLQALRLLYLNAGFVNFEIEHADTTLNDDKSRVSIDIRIKEGERYQFGDTEFLGQTLYSSDELKKEVVYQKNDQYSQANLDATSQNLINKLGNEGYYNAEIRPISRIDEANRIVNVDYYIDTGSPIYVRRINFSGNIKTKDEVLRREMRQLEATLASNQKIQLSRIRLMRTGFFKDVKVETRPVPNMPDQMDVNFIVDEQPSGSSTIAAGYSQGGGVTFQLELSQNNFMGTGNKVNAAFSRSETRDNYTLGYTDPYLTVDGISQSLGAYYKKTKYDSKNISNYVLDSFGANLTYSYPIDEYQRISGGLYADNTEVRGGRYMGLSNVKELIDDGGTADFKGNASFNHKYATYSGILGWSYSSLDKPLFPTKGASHAVDVSVGFGDKTYQKAVYRGNLYQPLFKGAVLRGYTTLGYGNNLPFYENFYAGGYGSVRGYQASSLGPRSPTYEAASKNANYADLRGEVVGGNAMATFGGELILPLPFKGDWVSQVRPVIFVEGGQVFDTTDKGKSPINIKALSKNSAETTNETVTQLSQDKQFRYSAGVGVTWNTPIGPVSISYAKPINVQAGDKEEAVQFQIGSVF